MGQSWGCDQDRKATVAVDPPRAEMPPPKATPAADPEPAPETPRKATVAVDPPEAEPAPAPPPGEADLEAPLLLCPSRQAWEHRDDEKEEESVEDDEAVEGVSVGVFRSRIHLAMRTAVACVVCAMPVIFPTLDQAASNATYQNYLGSVGGGVILMIVFTVYSNLGITMQQAWQGFAGTLVACLFTHVMSALMPGGAKGDHYYPPLVHSANILFIWCGLSLNFTRNFRIFMLSYHVYFVMEFMNPNSTSEFNATWAVEVNACTTTTMVTATMGLIVAVVVMLVPYPIRATTQSKQAALSVTNGCSTLVIDLLAYYARAEPSAKIAQLQTRASRLTEAVASLQVDIDGSWWENFDICIAGKRRDLLTRHATMMKKVVDVMFAMQVSISKEDFSQSHQDFMAEIWKEADDLVVATKRLLKSATQGACGGHVYGSEQEDLLAQIEEVKDALATLAARFLEVRSASCDSAVISSALQSVNLFVYCISHYARLAIDFSEDIINHPAKPLWICQSLWRAFKDTFNRDVLAAGFNPHSFCERNFWSITISYYIGFFCLGYSAIAAGTCSLLLSNFTGSALQKNLGRLQGVVIGNILPHIFQKMLGNTCDPFIAIAKGILIFFWETLTCYIYYSSAGFGYIGMLAAAFAMSICVNPCVPNQGAGAAAAAEAAFEQVQFKMLIETTIGVLVLTCVDMILASERASTGAISKFLQSMVILDSGIQAVFVPRKKTGLVKKGTIKVHGMLALTDTSFAKSVPKMLQGDRAPGTVKALLDEAMFLGVEADKEPRYYRFPWPADFFNKLCHTAYLIRADLNLLEQVLRGTDDAYEDSFADIRGLPAFQAVNFDVTRTMEDCIRILEAVLMNEIGQPMGAIEETMHSMEKLKSVEAWPELVEQINALGAQLPEHACTTVEDDYFVRLNVLLMLFESLVQDMFRLVKFCIMEAQ